MIVIEIRIGRERRASPSGESPAPPRPATEVRVGTQGFFALVGAFVLMVGLTLLPGSEPLTAAAVPADVVIVPQAAASDDPRAESDVDRLAERYIADAEAALGRDDVPDTGAAPRPQIAFGAQAETDAVAPADDMTRIEAMPADAAAADDIAHLDDAIRRDVAAWAARTNPNFELPVDDTAARLAARGEQRSMPESTADAVAPDPLHVADVTVAAPFVAEAPRHFAIVRSEDPDAEVVAAMREAAARDAWSQVRALRDQLGAEATLEGAKWDARIALAGDDPAAAVDALQAVALDAEGAQLRAAALLDAGRNDEAVAAYRTLLQAAPDDARLWLGLGLALEAQAADPAAKAFAFAQSAELARDAVVRAAAAARLVDADASR